MTAVAIPAPPASTPASTPTTQTTPTSPTTPATPTNPGATPAIWGKYNDPAAAEKGMREGLRAIGYQIGDADPVFGDKGLAASPEAGEALYRFVQANINQKRSFSVNAGVSDDIDLATAGQQAGLDFAAMGKTYAEKGELTPQDYKALRDKLGVSKGMAQEHFKLLKELAGHRQREWDSSLQGVLGDNPNARIEWAQKNMSPEELQAVQSQIDAARASNNPTAARLAYELINSRYVAKHPASPSPIAPQRSSGGPGGFASVAEVDAAMAALRNTNVDPFTDPSFNQRFGLTDPRIQNQASRTFR